MGDRAREREIIYREVARKGVVYAFSNEFMRVLRLLGEQDDRVVVEVFDAPKKVDGLFSPAIGKAVLR